MPKAAVFCKDPNNIDYVYDLGRRQQLDELSDCYPHVVTPDNISEHIDQLTDLELIFSTWGMWPFEDELFEQLPKLRAVFYAAGSVKGFATPFLERDITVVSAWAANAIPVAEYTLAQILLAGKQYWSFIRGQQHRDTRRLLQGNFNQRVALIGAGMIGKKVIELLRPFHIRVSVVDPFLSDADAAALGVEKVALERAFAEHAVVSNHLPNIPETVGMLKREHFASMPPGGTFINTGRGAQIVEADLQAVLRERTDVTALLDVTYPEPPQPDSAFYKLDNVFLTPHIAGSMGAEVVRMADFVIDECRAFLSGGELRYAVNSEMLARMA